MQILGVDANYLWQDRINPTSITLLTPAAHQIGRAYEKAPERERKIVRNVLVDYLEDNIIHVDFHLSEQKTSAGTGVYLGDEAFETISVRLDLLPKGYERDPSRYFGVPVSGDSMEPRYRDGEILIVSKEPFNIGEVGVVTLDGEGYVKLVGNGVLCSLNPAYNDIPINESIRFMGKVVGVLDPAEI